MPGDIIRVVLADDHAVVRAGLKAVLSVARDIEVIGEAKNGREAVVMVERFKPDVVVMDINMPRMNGIEATSSIVRKHPHLPVIGLSFYLGNGNREAFLKAGACLLLEKGEAFQHLPQAIYQAFDKSIEAGSSGDCPLA